MQAGVNPEYLYGATTPGFLLILHKNAQGEWKIKQEMWNAAPKPQ
jgi:ketosteroid isomerase-like protein